MTKVAVHGGDSIVELNIVDEGGAGGGGLILGWLEDSDGIETAKGLMGGWGSRVCGRGVVWGQ